MNILKILTLSGVATTLALSNNQMKIEDCPECDSTATSETTILAENETAQDRASNIQLLDANDTTEENTSDIELPDQTARDNQNSGEENTDQTEQIKYNYADYFACYENVKEKLTEILELNQKYSEKCENCNELTDEEKDKLEENFEELETLIAQLQDNNQNILCNITGECDESDDIMQILEQLQRRIDTIQNAMIMSRNFAFLNNPHSNIYGYYYRYYPKENLKNETENNDENLSPATDENDKNTDTFARKRWASNIDTYGPEYRNIDTFFNTALLDDNMFDYNGENYMGNYGMGYMGNPYMFGGRINGHNGSNGGYRNPNYNNQQGNNTQNSNEPEQNIANTRNLKIDTEMQDTKEQKRFSFGKNIDTYLDDTMRGNVNTMGGKKVTDYVRDLFNKHFKKNKNDDKKSTSKNDNQNDNVEQIPQSQINNYVDNFIGKNNSPVDENYLIDDNQVTSTFDENNSNENLPELKEIKFPKLY